MHTKPAFVTDKSQSANGGGPHSGRHSQPIVRPGFSGRHALLLLPALAIYLVVFIVPELFMLHASVQDEVQGGFTLALFHAFLLDPLALRALGNSLWFSFWTTLACLLMGFPLAYQAARGSVAVRLIILTAVTFPLFTSSVVRTFGWQVLLFPNGALSAVFASLGMAHPPVLIGTGIGVVLAQIAIFLPFMVMALYGTLRDIDPVLEQAAADLGDRPFMVWVRILLPLSRRAIIGGVLIVFSVSLSAYITPKLIGQSRVVTLATSIYEEAVVLVRYQQAAVYSVVLLGVTLLGAWLALRATERAGRQS